MAANARAARSLRRAYGLAQHANGSMAWPTPPIHDWETWLGILWKQHIENSTDVPLLLTEVQERAVWKAILGAEAADPDAVALLASRAWRLLSDFTAHGERQRSWTRASGDAQAFGGWAFTFDHECRARGWMARSDLAGRLIDSIQRNVVELPAEILLVGFDRLKPARQRLIDAVRTAGAAVAMVELQAAAESPRLVQATDPRNELATCAWWARRILEDDPAARIAVLAQDPNSIRGELEHTFRRILMPESIGIECDDRMPFEFSLGQPLARVPVVKAALLIATWLIKPLQQAAISWLLLSGFLAAEGEDPAAMATLDAKVRKYAHMPLEAPLETFVSRARPHSETARLFLHRLRGLWRGAQTEGVGKRKKTYPEWIDILDVLLNQVQWPGARSLDTVEYQALARWERLTGDVAGLGFDGRVVAYEEFVTVLDRYAGETIFAPESHDAAIQIMGAMESSGQQFDAIWFLGADDRGWPSLGAPNPLLPLWLQRKAAMPHSSLEVDWTLGLRVTRRIAASAPQCIFSYALRDAGGELRPSALLVEAVERPLPILSSEDVLQSLKVPAQPPQRCQTIAAEDGSSIPWPREIHAGGADILKRQSACAFQSFAVRRLGAEELQAAERGLTPRDRGNLLHSVLEAFWSKESPFGAPIKGRDELVRELSSGRLPELLEYHAAEVFRTSFYTHEGGAWSKSYLAIERRRLVSVLYRWLEFESGREPFTVEEHEKEFPTELNGLKLNLRVDRIDRVAGGRLILDYKTGTVVPSMWEGERPDEPQLPLYGVHGPVRDLRGVLFAQVRAGDLCLKGRVEDATRTVMSNLDGRSPLVSDPLTEDTMGAWADALSNLADQFLAGEASVAPKQYPRTCRYCALASLCRVAETFITPGLEEVDDGAGDGAAETALPGGGGDD